MVDIIRKAREESFLAGLKPAEFLACTPFETYEWCKAQAKRECREYRLALYAAWHAAVFQRQKKVPDLAKLMKRLDNPQPEIKSPEILMRKVRVLAAAFGGKWNDG